jgi:hypothetical protein
MATISLHPSVRERSKARLSANQLAEYAVYGIDRANGIVHDAKFVQSYIPSWYDDSERTLISYLTDPLRKKKIIYDEIERLEDIAKTSQSGDERDRANLDIAVLERFLQIENQLGLNVLGVVKPPQCAPLLIEKLSVSVQPDLLVHPLVLAGTKNVGAIVFRFSKGTDPESAKKPETRERRREERREMGRYVAVLAAMLLEKQFSHLGQVSPKHCMAIDIPLGEAILLPTSDRQKRTQRLKKACKQVLQMWPNVEPKASICA